MRFLALPLTYDYKNDENNIARNGYLHFDRSYALKFFFYLSDVNQSSGPFCCIPKTHIKGKELRKKAWHKNKNYKNVKNRIFLDYNYLGYKEEDITPVCAKKGSLIIFDTDMFHRGGLTNQDDRIVVRGHCRKLI